MLTLTVELVFLVFENDKFKHVYIINDLQITVLIEKVDEFIEDVEELSQTINDQQSIIDNQLSQTIIDNQIFDWLYHIKNLIVNSNWIKRDEKVQEFV